MIEIHRSALVLCPVEHLYHLINDIHDYPLFLDGVSSAKILEQSESEMLGLLVIKKAGIERQIITRNRLEAPNHIDMVLEEGPLDKLTGQWRIEALNDTGCKVSLDLQFNALKGIAGLAFGKVFKQVADNMVAAFVDRAHDTYT